MAVRGNNRVPCQRNSMTRCEKVKALPSRASQHSVPERRPRVELAMLEKSFSSESVCNSGPFLSSGIENLQDPPHCDQLWAEG